MRRRWVLISAVLLSASVALAGGPKPRWLDAMKTLHQGFKGKRGQVAQLGDSITYSMAFWSPIGWADPTPYIPDDGLPKKPKGGRWRDVIKGARDKGISNGNFSGWRVGDILKAIDKVLASDKPEVAIIMVGTNDIRGNRVPPDYRAGLEKVVAKCIAAHCIPILNTIPPRRGHIEAVGQVNLIVAEVARKHQCPLVDYCGAILRLRPGDAWDGALISKDGVHPTAGKTHDYSEENLAVSGYALRNYLNFMMFRTVYFTILTR